MNRNRCRLSADRAIALLASARRRRLIRYLADEADAVTDREELARVLRSETGSEHRTLTTVLAHQHLPKLADGGVIEYDHRSGAVRPTEGVEKLRPLLEACEELEASLD